MNEILSSLVSIGFHGVAYGMILYVISVGLSVTMGMMGFINLAHGVFAMAGGFVFSTLLARFGAPFPLALLAAFALVALASIVIERGLYARFYGSGELTQVLFSIGLIFVSVALARMAFGTQSAQIALPSYLRGQLEIGGFEFPAYRVFVIIFGALLALVLWFCVERTRFGAYVRAAVDNRAMAQSIGIDTRKLFTLTFALGSGMAGLGGALGADVLAPQWNYPLEHLVYFLIVVAVGGFGSLQGPLVAALLIGVADTLGKYWFPQFGAFLIYAATIGLLLWRPQGLFGQRT